MPEGDNQQTTANFGGSAGSGGYEFQSDAIAFVFAHILAQQPLYWTDSQVADIPEELRAETGGPGDDLQIRLQGGAVVEVQAKRGLRVGDDFWSALTRLVKGIVGDPSLYGILLIDTSSSGTIRHDLRTDLVRIGQGRTDNLKPLSQEVLRQLTGVSGFSVSTLRRLRIVVFDFSAGSGGLAAARALLRLVVQDDEVSAAWAVLAKDAQTLITTRGLRDVISLQRVLARSLTTRLLRPSHDVFARYISWLQEVCRYYTIGTLSKLLQIETAWVRLRIVTSPQSDANAATRLADWITQYHEWARLRRTEDNEGFDADLLFNHADLAVVVGGPGAGNTTLLRRIAFTLAADGRRVVISRLRQVAQLMHDGAPFDRALLLTAFSTFPTTSADAHRLLNEAEFLLLDGLDETDPYRINVARAIREWQLSHPSLRIVVSTRPVGHAAAIFDGWAHFEVLPLSVDSIRSHVDTLTEALFPGDSLKRFEIVTQLHDVRGTTNATRVASRNPLLLGFMVQLAVEDSLKTSTRAELFRAILQLHARDPADRNVAPSSDRDLAMAVFRQLAWQLHSHPATETDQLVSVLATQISKETHVPLLIAQRSVREAIIFWEDRRLLERLTVGHHEAYTFVHLALCEYGAALRLASHPHARDVVAQHYQDAHWREVILLASGAGATSLICEVLIDRYYAGDTSNTAATLNLDPRLIIRALCHRSRAIAIVAAQCISSGHTADIQDLATEALEAGGPMTIQMLCAVCEPIWGDRALDVLLDRMEKRVDEGCEWVFKRLPQLEWSTCKERLCNVIVEGLNSTSQDLVYAAAEAALAMPELYIDVQVLQNALSHSKKLHQDLREMFIGRDPTEVLCRVLTRQEAFSRHDLIRLAAGQDSLARAAAACAVEGTAGRPADLDAVLEEAEDVGALNMVLKVVLKLPNEQLMKISRTLVRLLGSADANIRCKIVCAMVENWAPLRVRMDLANKALADVSPDVRDAGLATVRTLTIEATKFR